jgi:hypothetical protein
MTKKITARSPLKRTATPEKRVSAKKSTVKAALSAGSKLSLRKSGVKKSSINPAMIEAPVTKPRNLTTAQADMAVRAYLSGKKK